jgi:hypothetical protein
MFRTDAFKATRGSNMALAGKTRVETMPHGFPLKPNDINGESLSVGDSVCIRSVASCMAELPEEDAQRLLALVGQVRSIVQFDRFGFVWLSFAASEQSADFCLFPTEAGRA